MIIEDLGRRILVLQLERYTVRKILKHVSVRIVHNPDCGIYPQRFSRREEKRVSPIRRECPVEARSIREARLFYTQILSIPAKDQSLSST